MFCRNDGKCGVEEGFISLRLSQKINGPKVNCIFILKFLQPKPNTTFSANYTCSTLKVNMYISSLFYDINNGPRYNDHTYLVQPYTESVTDITFFIQNCSKIDYQSFKPGSLVPVGHYYPTRD